LTLWREGPYVLQMKRALKSLVVGYLVLAFVSKAREAAGMMTCDCYPHCWCRKPGLSIFRWVFPRYHHNPGLEVWKKQQFDQ
jgi:hypothetical protein